MSDPFRYHPELRDKITAAEDSRFRDMTLASIEQMMRDNDLPTGWWLSDAERLALHRQTLAQHQGACWVFAYGSLMWDPALVFSEVRRAHLPGFARRFILRDVYGGRGTYDQPGLMAALDVCTQSSCDGLVFRIEPDRVLAETEILFQREMVAPAYIPSFVPAQIEGETVSALTFVADHAAELITHDISRADQISCLSRGTGIFGTSLEYLENVVARLDAFGIEDAEASALLREATAAA